MTWVLIGRHYHEATTISRRQSLTLRSFARKKGLAVLLPERHAASSASDPVDAAAWPASPFARADLTSAGPPSTLAPMEHTTKERSLDRGGPVVLHEEDPPPPCGHGVCIEMLLDDAGGGETVALSLRRTQRHNGGPAEVDGARASARVSLTTGRCTPGDKEADLLFAEHAWLRDAFVPRLAWLRERARRQRAQQDRSTCLSAFQRTEHGAMLPHDDLFPDDWDLLFSHGGETYWVIDHYCSNAACACEDIVVLLHRLDSTQAHFVGELRIDITTTSPRPKASSALAKLFRVLWPAHGAVLLERYREVRQAVRAHAAARPAARLAHETMGDGHSARNAPCPCGSGKKYKRCCIHREPSTTSSGGTSLRAGR